MVCIRSKPTLHPRESLFKYSVLTEVLFLLNIVSLLNFLAFNREMAERNVCPCHENKCFQSVTLHSDAGGFVWLSSADSRGRSCFFQFMFMTIKSVCMFLQKANKTFSLSAFPEHTKHALIYSQRSVNLTAQTF